MSDPAFEKQAASERARRQQQWLVRVGVALLVSLCVALLLMGQVLAGRFAQIEEGVNEQRAGQLYQAFNTDLRQLSISAHDYGEWDSAFDFVTHGDRSFVTTNFNTDSLAAMHVDVVWVVDRSGHELYSAYLDTAATRVLSPAPVAILDPLRRVMRIDPVRAMWPPAERLLHTNLGMTAYDVIEIAHTDRSDPTGALLLFARVVGPGDVARIQETFDQPLHYQYLHVGAGAAPLLEADVASLPQAVREWIGTGAGSKTLVWNQSAATTTAYALTRDIDGKPVALFSSGVPRSIYQGGLHATRVLVGGLALLLLLGSACIAWLALRLRRSFAATRAAERRYTSIATQLRETITLAEPGTGRIVEANDAVLDAMGATAAAIRTRTVFDLYPDLTPAALDDLPLSGNVHTVLPSRMRQRSGGTTDAEISITRMADTTGTLWCLVGHDVTHRRAAEQQQRASQRKLAHIAQHDSLTGLPNRLYLRSRLPRALRHAAAADRLLALLYLDIDHFKNINDSRGHGAGDQLLQIVAKRLRANVAAQDVVVRMGGDEFVIVAALLPDVAAAENLATRLQAAVQAPLTLDGTPLEVSASLGVAVHPRDGLDMEALLKHADIALYQAKAAGRRCHRLFSQDMLVRVSESVAMEQALRHGLGSEQFFMEYQPIIDLKTGRVSSLEALMRWRHPELGLVPPSQFIPIADASGLTVDLGLQALGVVLAQLQTWQRADVPVVPVAVNVSPVQIEKSDFCASVLALTSEYQVDPCWLRFEITETALLKDPEGLVGTLQTLRAQGSQVLIDDFGTGYSGLSYLARLPVDSLKIDRSFVGDLGRNASRTPIIGAIIDMARRLHLNTIAEGVETGEQAGILRDMGCDYAQGYLYSKAVTARHCQALLEQLGWQQPLTATLVTRVLHSA